MQEFNLNQQEIVPRLPVSFFEVTNLPSNPFYLDVGNTGDVWERKIIHSFCQVILGFVLDKSIEAKLITKEKKIFFNLITDEVSEYQLIYTTVKSTQSRSWFEIKILLALQTSIEKDIRSVVRIALESILGPHSMYGSPGSKILSEIIIQSETDLWMYKMHYYVSVWDNKKYPSKIELVITEEVKDQIRLEKEKFEIAIRDAMFDQQYLRDLYEEIRKITMSELRRISYPTD